MGKVERIAGVLRSFVSAAKACESCERFLCVQKDCHACVIVGQSGPAKDAKMRKHGETCLIVRFIAAAENGDFHVRQDGRFARVCAALRISATHLDKHEVASKGTCTKLNRDFKGHPIEEQKRDQIVEYLLDFAEKHPERAKRVEKRELVIEECILPAIFRLTDAACAMLAGHALNNGGVLRDDKITYHQANLLAKGHYGVRKHVEAAARQLVKLTGYAGELGDLIEEEDDSNKCYPCIYRVNRDRGVQLTLIKLDEQEQG